MDILTETNGEFTITTDKSKMDLATIHRFLSEESYWCKNVPVKRVKKAMDHSLNFGVFHGDRQVGYARVISDFSSVAYLGDVFILKEFRGQGLSKWMMETIISHPELQGLRRWILLTADAHELYRKYGWTNIKNPEKWMEKHDPDAYKKPE
ncbi:MAG: GNAT family N-acetyltransferase [Chloroflexi bacterium HGW-Chloroflexi-5]|jgi:GNAT superfamily N-acetyltransferase|nr:MAG: GNAT family N-acetyltransferase [Chloroflexi bacterium HGW-Chloroflexi-5]PKP04495.1 MAG: GNAT family N-acetyltransferase [Bacteroidetes bacterium HGW-Bacteroidetes-6]